MWLLGLLASTQQNVSEDREFKNKVIKPPKKEKEKGNFDVTNKGKYHIKGVIWQDFMFSFVFGVLQAICAYIRSIKSQR